LAWRLSTGPLSIAFLTPYFERALSPADGSYRVEIDDTILDWSQEARSVDVKLRGARVLDAGDVVVLQAPELYVSLSARALLRGNIAPRALSILQPSLKVTRTEAGDFILGTEGDPVSGGDSGNWTLGDLLSGGTGRSTNYLTRVNIVHARLAIDDRLLGVKWSAPDVNISMLRTENGINAATDLDLTVGEHTAAIQLNADYVKSNGNVTFSLRFNDLRPSALASVSERLAMLAPFDIPMGGSIIVEVDREGDIVKADFNLVGKAGHVVLHDPIDLDAKVERSRFRGTYLAADAELKVEEFTLGFADDADVTVAAPIDHAFPLREFTAQANWEVYANQVDIPSFKITLDRPVVEGALTAREADGGYNIDAAVKGVGFAFDDLMRYWPATMGANPRNWIEKHMPAGQIDDAHAAASLRWSEADGFVVNSIDGGIDAHEMVVDYLPPMPKITKGIAHAKFDAKKFDIAVLGGEAGGLTATGKVIIDNLDEVDQWTDIDLNILGPLSAVLATLDSPPFRFAHAVDLSPDAARGDTATQLKLRFIAENSLTVDQIQMSANAQIKGAALPGVAFGLPLSDGNLKLVLDNAGMDVTGKAVIGGLPSELQWRQNFDSKKAPFSTRYRVKTAADATVWREKVGLNIALLGPDVLSGTIAADITATMMTGGRGTVAVEMGLDDASLTIKDLGFNKPIGEPAHASVAVTLNQNRVTQIPKASVTGKDLAIETDLTFASGGNLASVRIGRFAVGETDVSGTAFPRANGWEIDLRGKKLDLKAVMEDKTPEDPNRQRGDSFAVSLNIEKVRLYDDRYLDTVRGTVAYDGLVVREVHLNAVPPDGGRLDVEITPQGEDRKVQVTSDNAGGVLRAFDLTDNVVGGQMNIAGSYAEMVPGACLGGRVAINNFRVRNAPILARLLNVATVVGLVDMLGGEGIGFDTLRIPFTNKDGVTRFENARASGLSIGLTASGSVNSRTETVDIEGEVIPANVLNSLLGRIPVLGGIFGGESGVFAISYRITGNMDAPDVSANPLTVITPGFTRKIFNIFGTSRDDETPLGCPKSS